MTRNFFITNLWLWKCSMDEKDEVQMPVNLDELRQSEWSQEFETLMRNRMLMGYFRYGKLGAKNKVAYDRINSARRRLDLYEKTGNTEHLVDVANLMLCEFVEGIHPNKHFSSIDDGEHTSVKK